MSWVVRTLGVLLPRGTPSRATLTLQTESSSLPDQVATSTSVRSTHNPMQDHPGRVSGRSQAGILTGSRSGDPYTRREGGREDRLL